MSETKKEIKVNFVDGVGIGKLTNLDIQDEFLSTPENPTYELRFRKNKNKISVELYKDDKIIPGAFTKCEPDQLSNKLTGKGRKDIVFEKIIESFGGDPEVGFDSLSDAGKELKNILVKYATDVYQQFKNTTSQHLNDLRLTGYDKYIFSEQERRDAENFLKNKDKWNIISKEIERTYTGQESSKMALFIKCLQAYCENYTQGELDAESAVGKTGLMDAIYNVFPDEIKIWLDEFSPTALRRTPDLLNKKLVVVSQAEGIKNKYHMMLASRDDKNGECLIVNTETGEAEKVKLPKATFISMSTNFFIDNPQNDTRTDRIFLDSSIKQNKKAGVFIAENLAEDTEVQEYLGKIETTKQKTIKNSIRVYGENIIKVSIPFALYIQENMDFNQQRAKRDLKSMAGAIEAITNFNRYDRETYQFGNITRLIATYEDFELYIKYCEEHTTQTYYDIPNQYKEVVNLIKKLSDKAWTTKGWVYITDIENIAESELGISRPTVQRYLKRLVENYAYIDRDKGYEYDENGNKKLDEEGKIVTKRGYNYKFTLDVPNTLFLEKFNKDKIEKKINDYKHEKIEQGATIKKYYYIPSETEIDEMLRCSNGDKEPEQTDIKTI